ncbi:FAD-dependent oxidoreductase [Nocardia sp. NBC_00511]|uniref:FAD-dependent oxidoreductase n=1 Tax=Nocardia sp. NBC_00511 TaxID=2903591 RepID=UPI0030E11689
MTAVRQPDFDVLIVGSGFGASVTALRLVEKGYRVGVFEAGRRFEDTDFAATNWDLRRYLWAPMFGCYGIQRIHRLRDCFILAGAGVGGGSLNYANTLYKPGSAFFQDPQWAGITDWDAELGPHYEQARRMLGVVRNPHSTPADDIIREVAQDMGVADTFVPTPVGVYFGEPGKTAPDPYFGGAGPERTGCLECGECMTGCRHGAKNTLVKNYLGLAERHGAQVHPMTTVTALRPQADGSWRVDTARTGARIRRRRTTVTAEHVVLAAGTWGTQRLLFGMRDSGVLPRLSARLGVLTRTNSEAILGAGRPAVDPGVDITRGVAITSSFHPTPDTHVEPVRYGKGSDAMGLLNTYLVDGGQRTPRWVRILPLALGHPIRTVKLLRTSRWSERTLILLVMQSLDNSITTYTRRGLFGRRFTSKQGYGEPNPTWIPAGHEVTRRVAEKLGAVAGTTWPDIFGIPMTAHFIGGCVIGADAEHGVIDPYHRVHGYPTLSITDGSAISANLGVNPSLTIAAQAERAASMWPNRGERDLRPAAGEPYRRVDPIAPQRPVVPEHAPAALRLTITPVRNLEDRKSS